MTIYNYNEMCITGHFWIVRGGKIIDWDFPEFQEVRDFHNCKSKAKYRLENKDIRRKMKNEHIIQNRANILKIKEENGEDWAVLLNDFPQPYKCGFNVIMEQILNGGQIAYGDMGWEAKETGKIWYEFEHSRPILDNIDIIKCIKGVCEGREPPEYYNIPKEIIKLCKVYTKRLGVENAVKMINK